MKTETVAYKAGTLACEGVVAWDDTGPRHVPLLLMAPNWAGITPKSIAGARDLAAQGYVVFLADLYGVDGRPKGTEAPMEFLQPLIKSPAETRLRMTAALEAMTGAEKAAVLAIHGADDPVAPKADRDSLEDEMRKAGARWTIFAMGGVVHSFTDPDANRPPGSMYSAAACRYGYALAHAFIADALAGKL
jgi:dienelactone hydrolase